MSVIKLDKTAVITGRSRKEENKRRTLNAALTIMLDGMNGTLSTK